MPQGIELVDQLAGRVRALHPRATMRSGARSSRKQESRETERGERVASRRAGPVSGQKDLWGSDAIAAMLRALDIPYIALNPGASYRGLHDSIVNYLGNERPQMLLCLHEESAVAIAHGYAKAAGRMMAAALHSNVGLMHAHDGDLQRLVRPRADADARRHRPVGRGQAPALDRLDPHRLRPGRAGARLHQVGQPAGLGRRGLRSAAARRADRAHRAARPGLRQPRRRAAGGRRSARCRALPDVARFRPPPPVWPAQDLVEQAAKLLSSAKNPVILAGRVLAQR